LLLEETSFRYVGPKRALPWDYRSALLEKLIRPENGRTIVQHHLPVKVFAIIIASSHRVLLSQNISPGVSI
jgi:hypothetical protein